MSTLLLDLASSIQQTLIERDEWRRLSAEHAADAAQLKTQRDSSREYAKRVLAERDAARAELAVVAAQRDAYLSRSVELATRVTELEARLAALTPAAVAPVEVDGFRVGDLVVAYDYAPEPIARFVKDFAHLDKAGLAVGVERLTRKPVEVGDAVRCISGAFAGRTGTVEQDRVACMYVLGFEGEGAFWTEPSTLVAVDE